MNREIKKIKIFLYFTEKIVGNSHKYKINKIVKNLRDNNVDFQFITSSENNAWLLNIRGSDTSYTPIPQSYILIDKK